jgi:hypothetical protein
VVEMAEDTVAIDEVTGRRRPVTRTRRVTLGRLSDAEREQVVAAAYEVFAACKGGIERATFERSYFADDAARVALFYGDDGAFAGFSSAAVLRVAHEGREHAVFTAPVFIDTRYKGGHVSGFFGLTEALRFKVREPRTPLAYLSVTSTPASYRLFTTTMRRVFPSSRAPTPAPIDALVREVARLRGLTLVDRSSWLVHGLGTHRRPEKLRRAQSLAGDPDARFYLEKNPHFEDGTSMLVWIPLDAADIGGALVRSLLRGFIRPA